MLNPKRMTKYSRLSTEHRYNVSVDIYITFKIYIYIKYMTSPTQLFHSGWKRRLLPPNNIRLFMTDTRQNSILYWRYRRGGGSKLREDLGAEDRRVRFPPTTTE